MKKIAIQTKLNELHQSDIYTLMLFLLYKLSDNPNYADLSKLCFLLDGHSLTRLLGYYAGKTFTVPSADEFSSITKAMLMYQYINLDGETLVMARERLGDITEAQKDKIQEIYLKIIPLMNEYAFDKEQIRHAI